MLRLSRAPYLSTLGKAWGMSLRMALGVVLVFGLLGSGCATYRITPKPVQTSRRGFFDQKFVAAHKRSDSQRDEKGEDGNLRSNQPLGSNRTSKVSSHEDQARAVDHRAPSRRRSGKSPSGFEWPVSAVEVTSVFGKRGKSVHEGIDLHAPIGTPVYASQTGVVLYAGSKIRGYGRMIVLRHRDQIATIYAHNSELMVHRGQSVKQGQQIAVSGATGHVSGPHVHFEVRRGMAALDPMKYLPKLSSRLTASK